MKCKIIFIVTSFCKIPRDIDIEPLPISWPNKIEASSVWIERPVSMKRNAKNLGLNAWCKSKNNQNWNKGIILYLCGRMPPLFRCRDAHPSLQSVSSLFVAACLEHSDANHWISQERIDQQTQQNLRCHSNIIEETKALRFSWFCMMSWRPGQTQRL